MNTGDDFLEKADEILVKNNFFGFKAVINDISRRMAFLEVKKFFENLCYQAERLIGDGTCLIPFQTYQKSVTGGSKYVKMSEIVQAFSLRGIQIENENPFIPFPKDVENPIKSFFKSQQNPPQEFEKVFKENEKDILA